jgi:TPR repeat protein
MYLNEEGIWSDEAKAAYWTLQAAKQKNVIAMDNMGFHYSRV